MASPENFICPFCNLHLSELCNCIDTADGAMFVGIYDGHGGDVTSKFIAKDLFPKFNGDYHKKFVPLGKFYSFTEVLVLFSFPV